jgi:hypothetical protein
MSSLFRDYQKNKQQGNSIMGDIADHISKDNYDYGPNDYHEEYSPGIEPGSGTYVIKPKSKPDPEFYYQEFKGLFKIIEIEHETDKAFLFYTEKGNFWAPKKLIKIKDVKNIFSWKIWKNFTYTFKPREEKAK